MGVMDDHEAAAAAAVAAAAAAAAGGSMDAQGGQQQPIFVNPKQYERIMKRREARARLENHRKVLAERKVRRATCVCVCNV